MSDCSNSVNKYVIVQSAPESGDFSVCNGILYVNTISACTENININNNIVNADGSILFNSSISACTAINTSNLIGCDVEINLHTDLVPISADTINLGTPIRRFRDINTFSGTSSVWTSTQEVITPNLNLGLDLSGNTRIITAENSIIQQDILSGGNF